MRNSVGKLPLISFLAACFAFQASAAERSAPPNVILLMVDGVRWQEVFHGSDPKLDGGHHEAPILVSLWKDLVPEGVLFGDPHGGTGMKVSNPVRISLPAYQSIMAGETQPCLVNGCARLSVETVQERLRSELKLGKYDVATIASWDHIRRAAEHVEGATFVNAGIEPLDDGDDDEVVRALNRQQAVDPAPWHDARYDRYTWSHAMHFLKKHQPRFMFISFDDSDDLGHRGDYKGYVEALHNYDRWVHELIDTLNSMGDYGRATTLIVTTDHGRGNGKGGWKHHGLIYPGAERVWLYGRSARTLAEHPMAMAKPRATPPESYTHLDIRPTIEAAMGLAPLTGRKRGRPISEIVP